MQFTKWHGLGNDFIIVDGFKEKIFDYSKQAIAMCDRHFGIGADGLVIILPSDKADFRMKIMNSDGSEAEMCGNVTRCFARYVYENGLTDKTKMTIETLAGIIKPELIFSNGIVSSVRVDMGEPRLKRAEIPMLGNQEEQAVSVPMNVQGVDYNITCVSMGNPHCVIFVDEIDRVRLEEIGPIIEKYSWFPRKINVEFVQVLSPHKMRMRVWERGAGITLACGTGASATQVAAVLNQKTERKTTIVLDGGELELEWGHDNHIYMTGPTMQVFKGEYLNEI